MLGITVRIQACEGGRKRGRMEAVGSRIGFEERERMIGNEIDKETGKKPAAQRVHRKRSTIIKL